MPLEIRPKEPSTAQAINTQRPNCKLKLFKFRPASWTFCPLYYRFSIFSHLFLILPLSVLKCPAFCLDPQFSAKRFQFSKIQIFHYALDSELPERMDQFLAWLNFVILLYETLQKYLQPKRRPKFQKKENKFFLDRLSDEQTRCNVTCTFWQRKRCQPLSHSPTCTENFKSIRLYQSINPSNVYSHQKCFARQHVYHCPLEDVDTTIVKYIFRPTFFAYIGRPYSILSVTINVWTISVIGSVLELPKGSRFENSECNRKNEENTETKFSLHWKQ